jgi:hypothetical protein
VAISFLMREKMITLKEAFQAVQQRRLSVCLSRPRWESLSRFEQELLKQDTLEQCVDLSHAPKTDAVEPVPPPDRPSLGEQALPEDADDDKGSKVREKLFSEIEKRK